MSFIKSLVFGSEGSYNVLGVPVTFKKESENGSSYSPMLGSIYFIAQLYSHTFFHEMGHALAFKMVGGCPAEVTIFSDGNGFTYSLTKRGDEALIKRIYRLTKRGDEALIKRILRRCNSLTLQPWKSSLIALAGPMAGVAFSSIKLVALTALKGYIPLPITVLLGIGPVFTICSEIYYEVISGSSDDSTDFGKIAQSGRAPLAAATIVLVSEVAFGVLAAIMLSGSV